MELAVLVKAVPRSESMRYDPVRRAVVRDGADLVLNPFDQRALRVALELRREGDRVTVVSLGPPAAGPLLREACAVGADRALHVCDPAFAGSDLLATSAVLASAVRAIRPSLVLAGARSTDSDTGLVGPEVAARLGLPVVSFARALRWPGGSSELEADVDTPDGWATVAVRPPAVLTVGEKIAKPLPVDAARFAAVPRDRIEVLGAPKLGLSEAEVGAFGSPTSVERVEEVAPRRLGRAFAEGSLAERVRQALEVVSPLLGGGAPRTPPLPWPPALEPEREIVVLVTGPTGAVEPEVLGTVTHLRRTLPAFPVLVAAYGPTPDGATTRRLEAAGALGGYALDPGGTRFDSCDAARGLASLLEHRPKMVAVVAPALPFGREVAGQLAASRSLGAVGDATGVRSLAPGGLEWSKPSFAGSTVAAIRCRSSPVVVTMPCGLSSPAGDGRGDGPWAWNEVEAPKAEARVVRRTERVEPAEGPEPEHADVVVALGAGVGGPEGIARLMPSVRRWGAAVVGTRRLVDAGWLPVRRQVGLTGRLLAPRLAVLLGVRGAPNHMVGWSRAGAVLAVNRDAEAPVFRGADAGIVGSLEETVDELAAPLARLLGEPSGT